MRAVFKADFRFAGATAGLMKVARMQLLTSVGLELLVVVAALVVCACFARRWKASALWRCWGVFARRRVSSIVAMGLLGCVVSTSIVAWSSPQPMYHDEFSNLLAADTFAHGRLSNPAHPLWEYFESFHTLQTPHYVSKYPPALGAVLAFGEVAFGRPILGVCLLNGLIAAAICWMLQSWTSPRWALMGGFAAALHPTLQLVWGRNYMGGGPAVLGAAVLFAALGRLHRSRRISDSIWLAVGVLILANSRPFEGALVCLPAAAYVIALAAGWLGRRFDWMTNLRRLFAPAAATLLVGATAMAYYNVQTTNHWWLMPYRLHLQTYSITPLFLWQSLGETKSQRHEVMEKYHNGWEAEAYRNQRTFGGWLKLKGPAYQHALLALLRPALALGLLAIPWLPRRFWFVGASILATLIGSGVVCWLAPHYLAPLLPPLMILSVEGIRRICIGARLSRASGRAFATALVYVQAGVFVLSGFLALSNPSPVALWFNQRASLERSLSQSGEEHLIIVCYSPSHVVHQEWVYNKANIDREPVVWARWIDPQSNQRLLEYFHDRRVWLLLPDTHPVKLIPVKT